MSGVVPKDPLDSSFFTSQGPPSSSSSSSSSSRAAQGAAPALALAPPSSRAPLAPHATANASYPYHHQQQQQQQQQLASSSLNTSIDLLSGGGENEGPKVGGLGSIKGLGGRGVGLSKGMAPPIPENASTEGECAQQ